MVRYKTDSLQILHFDRFLFILCSELQIAFDMEIMAEFQIIPRCILEHTHFDSERSERNQIAASSQPRLCGKARINRITIGCNAHLTAQRAFAEYHGFYGFDRHRKGTYSSLLSRCRESLFRPKRTWSPTKTANKGF